MTRAFGRLLAALVLAVLAAAWTGSGALAADLKFPALTGRVVDEAGVIGPEVEANLDQKLAKLEADTGRQLVVVTLNSLQGDDIASYGYQLGRAWGIGQKKENNGLLFIIAPNEKKVRVEVGYGLEGIITDALSAIILQSQVLPRFKAGDMEGGIVAGADALVDQLSLPPDEAAARAKAAAQAPAREKSDPVATAIVIVILMVFLFMMFRQSRRRGGVLPWLIAGALSSHNDRGGWGGGGGFGGGGGGFGGGGGSFGGGGSSGSW